MARRKRGFFAELQHQQMLKEREQRRQQAEELRLAKQAARERERLQREHQRAEAQAAKQMRDQHIQQQQADAAEQSRADAKKIDDLADVLLAGIALGSLSAKTLKRNHEPIPFTPDPRLTTPLPAPDWRYFAPPPPTGFGKIFKSGHERALAQAREAHQRAVGQHAEQERRRQAELEHARSQHQAHETARREQLESDNAQFDLLESRAKTGEPQAVEDYFELLLESSPLPADVPNDVEVAYQPDARKLLVIVELPGIEVIPEHREHVYVRTRDEIDAKPRPVKEIRKLYSDAVARLVLRTMRDVFAVQPTSLVSEVAVNGHVSTRNKATGKPERPCLISTSATRAEFEELVLDQLDPVDCLRHLNALVSPHPWDLEAVRPIFDPDLSKYRFVDSHDAASGLDSRPVLLKMQPVEFEHLIRQLFEAMGMDSWVTQASKDDGVDGVAVNRDPIMGGVCVIQAKRYSGIVPADAVRALAGTMDDKRASRGVLVTTSWFGKATHDFSSRHGRIQLIEGGELKHLLAEHLDLDVVIGELKRRN